MVRLIKRMIMQRRKKRVFQDTIIRLEREYGYDLSRFKENNTMKYVWRFLLRIAGFITGIVVVGFLVYSVYTQAGWYTWLR